MKKKFLLSLILALVLVLSLAMPVLAATSDDVTVTATPSYISIDNDPAVFDFATVDESGTPNTTTGWFTITNDSTVNITVSIGCNGWSGTTPWTYGAAGADTGQLKASDNDGLYDVTVPNGSTAELHTTGTPGTNVQWELQLDCPTSFTHGYEQTTTVTVSAAAS